MISGCRYLHKLLHFIEKALPEFIEWKKKKIRWENLNEKEKNINYLLVIFVLICPKYLMIKRLHWIAGISPIKTMSIQHFQRVQNPTNGHP